MAISITTVNNSAAVAKTFSEMGKDRTSSQWRNSSDGSSAYSAILDIKQNASAGRDARGNPLRRTSFSCTIARPIEIVNPNGSTKYTEEKVVTTVSITKAPLSTVISDTDVKDSVRYATNPLTDPMILALVAGEV